MRDIIQTIMGLGMILFFIVLMGLFAVSVLIASFLPGAFA